MYCLNKFLQLLINSVVLYYSSEENGQDIICDMNLKINNIRLDLAGAMIYFQN